MFGLIISNHLIPTATVSSYLFYFVKQLCSSTKHEYHHHNFTSQYLINSFGFSESAAISASQKIHFQTTKKPDSVLNLFTKYGFTNSQISTLIKKYPSLLVSNPDKTLNPKIEYLKAVGISDVGHFLSKHPKLLSRSLKNQMVPAFEFLNRFLHTHEAAISFKRCTWMIEASCRATIDTNMNILREYGVLESNLIFLLKTPRSLLVSPSCFKEKIHRLKEMGLDPLKYNFVDALFRTSKLKESTWERKFEVYRRWGWSDNDIISAFKKNPQIIVISEKKIDQIMDFLVNKMGWDSSDILRYTKLLSLSFQKRIVPRCLLVQYLLSKGLVTKKNVCLSSVIAVPEKLFLERFVNKHKGHVSELLSLYERKEGCL